MSGGEKGVDVGGDEIGDVRCEGDGGVEGGDFAAGGFGLREGGEGIGLIEQDLALEIGGLDEVAVDEDEVADAGASEERGSGGTGGSNADDGYDGPGEESLAGFA